MFRRFILICGSCLMLNSITSCASLSEMAKTIATLPPPGIKVSGNPLDPHINVDVRPYKRAVAARVRGPQLKYLYKGVGRSFWKDVDNPINFSDQKYIKFAFVPVGEVNRVWYRVGIEPDRRAHRSSTTGLWHFEIPNKFSSSPDSLIITFTRLSGSSNPETGETISQERTFRANNPPYFIMFGAPSLTRR